MNTSYPRPKWLDNAVFYEIYPQSFQDYNGDGIGDIPGIISRLDYLKELGVDALWLNPLLDSPFKDAGYDVRDYKLVAPRYGTNEDLVRLFDQAHARGIRVLLDLVPGHTSEEHAWFKSSARPEPNEFSDRYVWTDSWIAGGDGYPFIGGETERDGTYILNFFKCQPALNYGWAHPKYPWQDPALGPTARKTCDAMVDVMRFWLSAGADGFRVDMANSLVKHDDEGKPYTIKTWHYMFDQIRPEFPEAAFVAEWGVPSESVSAGFDMDFYLDWRWDNHPNGYNILLRNTNTPYVRENDLSYFNADASTSICGFLEQYEPQLRAAEKAGAFFSLITCNHDTWRVAPRLTERELGLAWATILTLPGVPFIYYGDEIGLRHQLLPTKEGGYVRTGARTPMQWDSGDNLGFSTAAPADLYLPVDTSADAPTVAAQQAQPDSLWHTVARVLECKRELPALAADSAFTVLSAEPNQRLFVFKRENVTQDLIVAVNPAHATAEYDLAQARPVRFSIGSARVAGTTLQLGPQSFAIL